jgi:hypothetical protein
MDVAFCTDALEDDIGQTLQLLAPDGRLNVGIV